MRDFDQVYLVFRFEIMVARIKADMDKMEKQLAAAEASVESAGGAGALRSFMPLFFVCVKALHTTDGESNKI